MVKTDTIVNQDCIVGMQQLPPECVDLVFADPPFNIGYQYDTYQDNRTCDDYMDWSDQWIREVVRILKPNGTFWLAIGDEFAAELKILATRTHQFVCRSWVIWYYTFGVHCVKKFTRSHAHLFHFVKNGNDFTFNDEAVRVPSARQMVYNDRRANAKGRIPDDTWILRPQELMMEGFAPNDSVCFFPRVCGTFKERTGWHGCQMPEQLLGRIIRVSSNPGDTVLDPFLGSGTTVKVAKKLDRRYLGFELSDTYFQNIAESLDKITVGDPLTGTSPTQVNPAFHAGLLDVRPSRVETDA